ncbi:hypothetical protein IWW38_005280, partial [Coemansia aciculifera]
MQQAAQMTMSMNMMMEELVKRTVQVGVHAERLPLASDTANNRSRYGCVLRVSVRNKSPIPLLKLKAKLWFSRRVPLDSTSILLKSHDRADECQLEISSLDKRTAEILAT